MTIRRYAPCSRCGEQPTWSYDENKQYLKCATCGRTVDGTSYTRVV